MGSITFSFSAKYFIYQFQFVLLHELHCGHSCDGLWDARNSKVGCWQALFPCPCQTIALKKWKKKCSIWGLCKLGRGSEDEVIFRALVDPRQSSGRAIPLETPQISIIAKMHVLKILSYTSKFNLVTVCFINIKQVL